MSDFERPLRRREAAEFLTERGYTTAPTTLAKYASVGGGPAFFLYGRRPLYTPTDLLAWAKARSTEPRRSTSHKGKVDAPAAAGSVLRTGGA